MGLEIKTIIKTIVVDVIRLQSSYFIELADYTAETMLIEVFKIFIQYFKEHPLTDPIDTWFNNSNSYATDQLEEEILPSLHFDVTLICSSDGTGERSDVNQQFVEMLALYIIEAVQTCLLNSADTAIHAGWFSDWLLAVDLNWLSSTTA